MGFKNIALCLGRSSWTIQVGPKCKFPKYSFNKYLLSTKYGMRKLKERVVAGEEPSGGGVFQLPTMAHSPSR